MLEEGQGVQSEGEEHVGVESTEPSTPTEIVTKSKIDRPEVKIVEDKLPEIKPKKEAKAAETAAAVEAYKTSGKYKVYGEDKDYPEWATKLATSKEYDEQLRTYLQKGDAFDVLKPKHEELTQQLSRQNQNLMELQHYIDNDLGLFFKKIQVPDERVIAYVKTLIQEHENPALKAQNEQNRTILTQGYQNQRTSQQLSEENQILARNAFEIEYERVLSLPEISDFKKKFEKYHGVNSFRAKADQYGRQFYATNRRDTTILDAVQSVMKEWGPVLSKVRDEEVEVSDQEPSLPTKQAGKKPVIPNVGRGTATASPTKPKFKTMAELRKYAKRLAEAEQ